MGSDPGPSKPVIYVIHFIFFTGVAPILIYLFSDFVALMTWEISLDLGLLGLALGIPMVVIGILIMLYAEVIMYRYGDGTPIPFYKPPRNLLTQGIYSCTRNPMYLGTTMEYMGFGLILNKLYMIIISLLILCIAISLYTFHEVPYLRRSFGERFERYMEETPTLIPRIGCLKKLLKGLGKGR